MKILIVAANIISHSPRGFRTAELADEFSRLGHSVTLYSALEAGKPLLVNDLKNILIKDLGKTKFKELKCRKGFVFSYVIKAINRLGNLLFDYPMIEYYFKTKKAIRNESGYDMMISIAFPYSIHWGCA